MDFATTVDDGITHGFDHLGQTICTDMRMGISEDGRRGPVLTKNIQDLVRITPFL